MLRSSGSLNKEIFIFFQFEKPRIWQISDILNQLPLTILHIGNQGGGWRISVWMGNQIAILIAPKHQTDKIISA